MSQSAQAEIITCIPSNCQHLPNGKAIYSHHGLRSNHWANYKFTGRRFGEEGLLWRIRARDGWWRSVFLPVFSLPLSLVFCLPPFFFTYFYLSITFPSHQSFSPCLFSRPPHFCLHLFRLFDIAEKHTYTHRKWRQCDDKVIISTHTIKHTHCRQR